MRCFSEIEEDLGLKKFLASELGTLYFVPSSPGSPRVIVRHFDNQLSPQYVGAFVEMLEASQDWINKMPKLDELVRVEQPLEVGSDFVARPHHTYYTSTDSYEEEHNPAEAPSELELMRNIVRSSKGVIGDAKTEIIASAMCRSLLEPTTKTYFNSDEMKFIVVEPKFIADEVERWTKD